MTKLARVEFYMGLCQGNFSLVFMLLLLSSCSYMRCKPQLQFVTSYGRIQILQLVLNTCDIAVHFSEGVEVKNTLSHAYAVTCNDDDRQRCCSSIFHLVYRFRSAIKEYQQTSWPHVQIIVVQQLLLFVWQLISTLERVDHRKRQGSWYYNQQDVLVLKVLPGDLLTAGLCHVPSIVRECFSL